MVHLSALMVIQLVTGVPNVTEPFVEMKNYLIYQNESIFSSVVSSP